VPSLVPPVLASRSRREFMTEKQLV
jgi:hypothetical protein